MRSKKEDWINHINRSHRRDQIIELLYKQAFIDICKLASTVEIDQTKLFDFKDYPILSSRFNTLIRKFHGDLRIFFEKGINDEWERSNIHNDEMVTEILKNLKLPEEVIREYKNKNLPALKAFQDRKVNQMNLSERVWNLVNQAKEEFEMAIDIGVGEGRTAQQISQDIRQYLQEPNKLFRRVRDKHGQLQLSKKARAYRPGMGVYRSSYKNAMRVSRSENNMAYRSADNTRWAQLPFVVGFEIKRSNNVYDCDVCEGLKGFYPKDFVWVSNHPHCRCFMVSVLASTEEIDKLSEMILNGEDISSFKSRNEIKKLPVGFTDFITNNKDKLLRMRQQPYYIRDNFKNGHVSGGLKLF